MSETKLCHGCGKGFAESYLVSIQNNLLCISCKDHYLQAMKEGLVSDEGPILRKGNLFECDKIASLPHRCLICNDSSIAFSKLLKFTWQPNWVYFLLFAGLIPLLIVSAILSKKTKIEIHLCYEHNAQRKKNLLIRFLSCLFAILFLIGSCFLGEIYILIGFIIFIILIIVASILGNKATIIRPVKVFGDRTYYKGAGTEFLNSLNG
jgi:hypothetical protein